MTIVELSATVTTLEIADDTTDVIALLEQVIVAAEPLLVAAEAAGETAAVGEIARELQRAFEAVAERSEPAVRTRMLVGASFWSLRAASADIEDVASADYGSVVMLPTIEPRVDAATTLDFATPAKTPSSAADDLRPLPGLPSTADLGGGSDTADAARQSGGTTAAPSGDSQTTTSTLTPSALVDTDS